MTVEGSATAELAPISEAPPQETVQVPKEEPKKENESDFSTRFAALTRKERALEARARQLKQIENDPSYKEYQTFRELKADPRRNAIKLIESLGVPLQDFYSDLTGLVLNDGKPSVELELKTLKDQIEQDRKSRESEKKTEQEQKVERAVNQYKTSIVQTVESNLDDFELMSLNTDRGSIELAYEVAENYYDTHKQVLDPKKACQMVEDYLVTESRKLLSSKKLAVKEVPPQETTSEPPIGAAPKAVITPPKTLTNNNVAAPASAILATANGLPLDPDKRRAATAAKLREAWAAQGRK